MDASTVGVYVAACVTVTTAYLNYRSQAQQRRIDREKNAQEKQVAGDKTQVDADAAFRDDLREELASLRQEYNAFRRENIELARNNAILAGQVETQAGQLKHVNELLTAKLAENKTLAEQVAACQTDLAREAKERMTAEANLRRELAKAVADRDGRIAELEASNRELQAQIQTLQSQAIGGTP